MWKRRQRSTERLEKCGDDWNRRRSVPCLLASSVQNRESDRWEARVEALQADWRGQGRERGGEREEEEELEALLQAGGLDPHAYGICELKCEVAPPPLPAFDLGLRSHWGTSLWTTAPILPAPPCRSLCD
jgi:hypothetical protein